MATAQTIVTDALTELGVLADGETPSAVMADDAFRALNRLCNLWSNDQAFAYVSDVTSIAMTNQASFTIGPTGIVVAARPISIDSAYLIRDGITYPVRVLDYPEWDMIAFKGQTGGNTTAIYYAPSLPDGVVNVWPLATGCTLYLRITDLVTSFPDLATDVVLPPGYEEAFIKNLAVDRAPSYKAQVSPLTMRAANKAMRMINRTNSFVPIMNIDPKLTGNGRGSYAGFIGGF